MGYDGYAFSFGFICSFFLCHVRLVNPMVGRMGGWNKFFCGIAQRVRGWNGMEWDGMELCTFTLSVLALNSRFLIICLFCLLDSKRLLFLLFPFSFFSFRVHGSSCSKGNWYVPI